ncbi:hypothetical protein ACFL27_04235 [candidate division CSSED10-310 bacterium]|uniref:DUF4097 domain-containing protein n=1 Tax=candidate division CSSED10-310 bacterium TaxID=2855610 RepID=A0ABV6YT69_UNCC1
MIRLIISIIILSLICAPLLAGTQERKFEMASGKELTVDIDLGGAVDIIGWDKEVFFVTIKYRGTVYEADAVEIEKTAAGVEIEVHADAWQEGESPDLQIKIPQNTNISINTLGGDVSLSKLEGSFKGQSTGGDLVLKQLKGDINMTTIGGDINLADSDLDGKLSSIGGSVNFEDVVGNVDGKTIAGEVHYKNVKARDTLEQRAPSPSKLDDLLKKTIQIQNSIGDLSELKELEQLADLSGIVEISSILGNKTGDIDIYEAPDGADLQTMGGDIKVHKASKYIKAHTMGGQIEIDHLEGKASVSTMGGNILIRAVDGPVKAKTMAGNIQVVMIGQADQGERAVSLTSLYGNIEITLPQNFSGDFDVELAYTKNSSQKFKIQSDFKLKIEETKEWQHTSGTPRKSIIGKGKIRGGKNKVRIRTINGDITIRESK